MLLTHPGSSLKPNSLKLSGNETAPGLLEPPQCQNAHEFPHYVPLNSVHLSLKFKMSSDCSGALDARWHTHSLSFSFKEGIWDNSNTPNNKDTTRQLQRKIKNNWRGFLQVFWHAGVSGLLRHVAKLFCTEQHNGISLPSPPIHALGWSNLAAVKIQHPKVWHAVSAQERKGEREFQGIVYQSLN